MGWDRKARGGSGGYFYVSVRHGSQVRKLYLGTGERAWEVARQVEARRQEHQAQREALLQEQAQIAAAEQALLDLQKLAAVLVEAVFVNAGYHQHRGQYRRRRDVQDGRG